MSITDITDAIITTADAIITTAAAVPTTAQVIGLIVVVAITLVSYVLAKMSDLADMVVKHWKAPVAPVTRESALRQATVDMHDARTMAAMSQLVSASKTRW